MFTFGLAGAGGGFDPLALLLMALAVEAVVGEARAVFRLIPHPIVVIGGVIGWFDAKLNRDHRSDMDRALRGAVTVLIIVVGVGAIGWAVSWLTRNHHFGWLVEFFGVVALLAGRGLYDAVRRVAVALDHEGLDGGRQAVAHIVGRDPHQLDQHGVARAAIESMAENFADAVVAPVFWYVLFGFPGILIYKAVNTMDSMIGHRTEKYRAFGMVAARLDDVLNIFPARLSGLFFVIASAVTPGASPLGAFKAMMRDAGKHRSMNAGWPEGAVAGALGLALAGPRRYRHEVIDDAWMGDGTAKATVRHMRRALYLFVVASLVNAMFVAALVVVRYQA